MSRRTVSVESLIVSKHLTLKSDNYKHMSAWVNYIYLLEQGFPTCNAHNPWSYEMTFQECDREKEYTLLILLFFK